MTALATRPSQHDALGRLTDRRLLRELAYVDGRWTAAANGAVFEVADPATGVTVARVARLGAAEADRAIAAAEAAFPAWRALLPQERAAKLRNWFDRILAAKEDLALLMTLEQGKPLAESRGEIDYGAGFVEWFAEEAKRLNVESVTSHLPGAEMMVRREPLGVVGIATPWNFPCAMLTRKAAAALAAGCTVVAHPSSQTPLSALALAELAERAGIPAGVLNIVTGDPEPIVGRICADKRVRAVSFTGSTEIGRLIAERCAPTIKRLAAGARRPRAADRLRRCRSGPRRVDRDRRQVRNLGPGLPGRQPDLCRAAGLCRLLRGLRQAGGGTQGRQRPRCRRPRSGR